MLISFTKQVNSCKTLLPSIKIQRLSALNEKCVCFSRIRSALLVLFALPCRLLHACKQRQSQAAPQSGVLVYLLEPSFTLK